MRPTRWRSKIGDRCSRDLRRQRKSKPRFGWITLCRREDAPHQAKFGLIDVGRLHRHRQRADPDAEVTSHASLQRCELDKVGIALRAEVYGVSVYGELQLALDDP